jgi:hypothetical protein
METPAKYVVDKALYPSVQQEQVLMSAYFQCVASTADSMIISGALETGALDEEEIIDRAIAVTDLLIEKVGERM